MNTNNSNMGQMKTVPEAKEEESVCVSVQMIGMEGGGGREKPKTGPERKKSSNWVSEIISVSVSF